MGALPSASWNAVGQGRARAPQMAAGSSSGIAQRASTLIPARRLLLLPTHPMLPASAPLQTAGEDPPRRPRLRRQRCGGRAHPAAPCRLANRRTPSKLHQVL